MNAAPQPPSDTADSRARATSIARTLRAAGYEALLCGGAVRDRLLGRTPKDHDVATSARPEQVLEHFPRALTIGAQFGVVVVVGPPDVEVATFRSDRAYVDGRRPDGVDFSDPPTDASRRDFTVNGLFEDPETGDVVDYVSGLRDLRARLVRAIGDPEARFREDHLRILRAVRFAVQLNFAIEPETFRAVCRMAGFVDQVSPERVREELLKILVAGRGRGLRLLAETGLLAVVLPEIDRMRGVPHPPQFHPEGDVFAHTCLVLDGVDLDAVATQDGVADRGLQRDLLLAALLHDVAKPDTLSYDPDGRVRFNAHEARGRPKARALLERLRLPRRSIDRVEALVGQHMRFGAVTDMRESKLRRFLGQDDVDLHLALHEADTGASHGRRDALDFCRERLREFESEPILPPPLLSGQDVLDMGYPQGPVIGEILRWVQDQQLEGALESREAAARRVRDEYPQPRSET